MFFVSFKSLFLFVITLSLLACGQTNEAVIEVEIEPEPSATVSATDPAAVLGGDKDANGCIASAGYLWCARIETCVRPGELAAAHDVTNTEDNFNAFCSAAPIGVSLDEGGCNLSAGYSWCAKTEACERPWELAEAKGLDDDEAAFKDWCASE